MFCNNCGTKLEDNVKFCPGCGQPVENKVNNSNINENTNIESSSTSSNNTKENININVNIPTNQPQFINGLSYQPIGMWGYFGYEILFGLPLIGLIFMIIFSFGSQNINVRNFARAFLFIRLFIWIIIFIVATSLGVSVLGLLSGRYL